MSQEIKLSLREFMLHSELAEHTLITLLDQGLLPCSLDEDGRLFILLNDFPSEKLPRLLVDEQLRALEPTADAQSFAEVLSPLLEEAVELALQWLATDLSES